MAAVPFTEEDLHELYMWVDEIPISRPKRNIARDFADGCCVAEIVKFFFPKIVDVHNYAPAMSISKKRSNWNTLNAKVFRRLYFEVPAEEIEDIISAVPGAVERFLRALRIKISQIKAQRQEQLANGQGYPRNYIGYAEGNGDDYAGPMDAFYSTGGPAAAPAVAAPAGGTRPVSSRGPAGSGRPSEPPHGANANEQARLLAEKERTILELRETVGILSEKIMKLEELLKVKDDKLNQYRAKFGKA